MPGLTEFCVTIAGMVALLPLIGAIINGSYAFSGAKQRHAIIHSVACGSVGLSFLITVGIFVHLLGLPAAERTMRNGQSNPRPLNVMILS